jgi:hypothetical protein
MDLSLGEIVIYAVVFWIISQILLGVADGWQLAKLNNRLELIKEISDLIHQVKVEKIGEVEYWFDLENDQFLGQGKTTDEIIDHIKNRFPNHIFLIDSIGGVSKQTDWKLIPAEDFKKVTLTNKDL